MTEAITGLANVVTGLAKTVQDLVDGLPDLVRKTVREEMEEAGYTKAPTVTGTALTLWPVKEAEFTSEPPPARKKKRGKGGAGQPKPDRNAKL